MWQIQLLIKNQVTEKLYNLNLQWCIFNQIKE